MAESRSPGPNFELSSSSLTEIGKCRQSLTIRVIKSRGAKGTVVGLNNSTDFLRATRAGTLIAEALPLHLGRTPQLWEVINRAGFDAASVFVKDADHAQALPTRAT